MRLAGSTALAAFALLLGTLAAPPRAAFADGRTGIRNAESKWAVVHPGSRVRVDVEIEPNTRLGVRAVTAVTMLGFVETPDRKLAALGPLAASPLGSRGGQFVGYALDVPKNVASPSRLHVIVTLNPPAPGNPVTDVRALSGLGHEVGFDVVPAPTLVVDHVEVPGTPRVGQPVVVSWHIRRTTAGRVGPLSVGVRLVAGRVDPRQPFDRGGRDVPVVFPDSGEFRDDTNLGDVREPGPHTIVVFYRYDGDVAADVHGDLAVFAFDVRPGDRREGPPPAPPTAPAPGTPAPPPAPPAPANLVVAIPERFATPMPLGQPFAIPFVVENRGGTAATAFRVTLVLVTDRGERVMDVDEVPAGLAPAASRRGRLRAELPADTPSGLAHFRVVADREGRVAQSDRSDDVVEIGIPLAGAKPNLIVRRLSTSSERVLAGETVVLEAVVANVGLATSPPCRVSFGLSDSRRGPLSLGDMEIPPVPAGREFTARFVGRVMPATTPGTWALTATADSTAVVDEIDETDNVLIAVGALQVEPAAAPTARPRVVAVELEGVAPSPPPELDPDEEIVVRARVANTGRQTARSFDVVLWLTSRDRPTPSNRGWIGVVAELGRATEPTGLPPDTDSPRRFVGRIPVAVPPGHYWIVAVADPSAEDPQSFAFTPIVVRGRARFEALEPGVVLDRDEGVPGQPVAVSLTVRNAGNRVSDRTGLAVVLEPASTGHRRGPGAVETPLGSILVEPLRPAEMRHVGGSVVLPSGTLRGRYRISLRAAGPAGTVIDLGGHPFAVRGTSAGADLVAYDAHATPSLARAGEFVRATVRVGNLGDAPSPPTRMSVALADVTPPTVLGWADVPPLAPKENVDVSVRVRLPETLPLGRTWLEAHVDPERLVRRGEHDDDVTAMPIDVTGRFEGRPRLTVGVMTIDRLAAVPGGSFDVRARIQNRGTADVVGLDVEGWLVGVGQLPAADLVPSPGVSWRLPPRRTLATAVPHGGYVDFAERFLLPIDVAPGIYDFRLVLDPDRRLDWPEGVLPWTEGLRLEIGGTPADAADLGLVSVDARVLPDGRHVAVSAMLKNKGPGSSPAFDVEAVLASREGRGGWWLPLGLRAIPAGIGANVETRARFDLEVPPEVPAGDYRIVVRVDPRRIADAVRGNDDSMARDVTLGEPPAAAAAPIPEENPQPVRPPPLPPPGPPIAGGPVTYTPSPTDASPAPRASADSSLPLALAPLLPSDGLSRDRSAPVTFLLSQATARKQPAVLDVLLEWGGTRRTLGSFDVPVAPAGVVTSVEGRLRAPAEATVGEASLLLIVRASADPSAAAREPLRVPVTVR